MDGLPESLRAASCRAATVPWSAGKLRAIIIEGAGFPLRSRRPPRLTASRESLTHRPCGYMVTWASDLDGIEGGALDNLQSSLARCCGGVPPGLQYRRAMAQHRYGRWCGGKEVHLYMTDRCRSSTLSSSSAMPSGWWQRSRTEPNAVLRVSHPGV